MTVNRFVITKAGLYFDGKQHWTANIWEAEKYELKPWILPEGAVAKLISIEYKEYPYEIEES